jgi:predicted Rossmann fold nucleotide-binding protein DprA/Smf involved in DNA uptake
MQKMSYILVMVSSLKQTRAKDGDATNKTSSQRKNKGKERSFTTNLSAERKSIDTLNKNFSMHLGHVHFHIFQLEKERLLMRA